MFYDFLKFYGQRQSEKLCYQDEKDSLTYGEFFSLVERYRAYFFSKINLKKEKNIVLVESPSFLDDLAIFYALNSLGAIVGFLPADFSLEERESIDYKFLYSDLSHREFLENDYPETSYIDERENKEFLLAFSSGSKGYRSCLLRKERSWLNAFLDQNYILNIDKNTRLLINGPLVYTANFNIVLSAMFLGASILFSKSLKAKDFSRDLFDLQPTNMYLVPTLLRFFTKKIRTFPESLKTIVTAGEKLDLDTVKEIVKKDINLLEYYGASELGHISYISGLEKINRPKSVGRIFPKVRVKIIDKEICVKTPYQAELKSRQEYIPSGDLGKVKDGFLYVYGRKGNVLIRSGKMFSLDWLENQLQSIPEINNVVSVKVDDTLRGENYILFLELDKKEGIKKEELEEKIRQILNPQDRPKKIIFVEQFKLNTSGKIDKNFLREKYL